MSRAPGAIVVSGDYQGLGIVRSLGRQGIEVVVIDDEHSIGRYSRYAVGSYRFGELRTDEQIVGALLSVAERRDVEGWVVYPTREETVAALSRHREQLSERFRIPTPDWSVTRFAWDKRNTYARAAELNIPTPRTWRISSEDELDTVDGEPPYVIKPAIKEHFFYATKCKAWRANSRDELATAIPCSGHAGWDRGGCRPGAHSRGWRTRSWLTARCSSTAVRWRACSSIGSASIPSSSAAPARSCEQLRPPRSRRRRSASFGRSTTTGSSSSSTSTTGAMDFPSSWTSTRVPGAITASVRVPVSTSRISFTRTRSDFRSRMASRLVRASPGSGSQRMSRRPRLNSSGAAWTGEPTSALSVVLDVESVFTPDDLGPGFAELALLPYLAIKKGI